MYSIVVPDVRNDWESVFWKIACSSVMWGAFINDTHHYNFALLLCQLQEWMLSAKKAKMLQQTMMMDKHRSYWCLFLFLFSFNRFQSHSGICHSACLHAHHTLVFVCAAIRAKTLSRMDLIWFCHSLNILKTQFLNWLTRGSTAGEKMHAEIVSAHYKAMNHLRARVNRFTIT